MALVCGTRPRISIAAAQLSRFLENPVQRHWDADIRVIRFLLKIEYIGITYDGHHRTELVAYFDSDWPVTVTTDAP